MDTDREYEELLIAQGEARPSQDSHALSGATATAGPPRRMGFGQMVVVAILLTVVLVPPLAGFYSYFSGVPLHLLAAKKEDQEDSDKGDTDSWSGSRIALASSRAHTVQVPEEVCATLGIRKGEKDSVELAQPPKTMKPLVLPGSTALDPVRLARIRARFAPARVVKLAERWDYNRGTGQTEYREIRPGDKVAKGDPLAVFYSVDVGSKKNDLLQALVQIELDQEIMDKINENVYAVPAVYRLTQERAVQGDRTEIHRALNNLKAWDIPQQEIDDLHAEAKKIHSEKGAWYQTPEGRWVKGEKNEKNGKSQANGKAEGNHNGNAEVPKENNEDPWGRVTLRAPFDGVIVERNVHVDEMVVDNTVNLFQIADVSRLLVTANCPEDQLPILESLTPEQQRWTVRTVGASPAAGLAGTIDEIGYIIDPNQHTAIIKGYVENPGQKIRGGQYVTATVNIPPPDNVVEIPVDALVEGDNQSLVFVQPDAAKREFTMRRVEVTHRFDRTVFVRKTPIPKEEQLTAAEKEEGLLPKEPLLPGERVLTSGAVVELKAAVLELESRPKEQPSDLLVRARTRAVTEGGAHADKKPKTGKG
jgi:cobalt-zinc-cadmium efflux system membrane fusion protein